MPSARGGCPYHAYSGFGLRVLGLGLRVTGLGGLGFRVWGLGFNVWGFGSKVFGRRVWGLGFMAQPQVGYPRPLINKPPPLSRNHNRDSSI